MVKAIEQIRRDLNTLTDKVIAVRQSLEGVYVDYLDVLGTSIEKQFILASFQLCTQVYPDNLLALSYDQKQELQQSLRLLAKQTHTDLCRIPTEPEHQEPGDATQICMGLLGE